MSNADDDRTGSGREGTEGPPIKLVTFLVLAVLLAIFFFQNTHTAPIEFLWMDASWPVWIVIGGSAVVGAALAKLAGFMWNRARSRAR